MSGGDGLRHGGHAYRVGTQGTGGPYLRRGFVLGAGEVHIYTLPQLHVKAFGGPAGRLPQGGRVDMAHVREPGAEFIDVGSAQGADAEELDVVGDEHNVAHVEFPVHRAGSVGDNQGLRPQQPHHPDRVADISKAPALIGVEPSLHHRHVLAGQAAKHELPLMVRGSGALHVGHLGVGHHDGVLHLIAQRPQAGAQDQQRFGRKTTQTGPQGLRAFLILFKGIGLHHSFPPHSRQKSSPSRVAAPQVAQVWASRSFPIWASSSAIWVFRPSISSSLACRISESVGVPVWVA